MHAIAPYIIVTPFIGFLWWAITCAPVLLTYDSWRVETQFILTCGAFAFVCVFVVIIHNIIAGEQKR